MFYIQYLFHPFDISHLQMLPILGILLPVLIILIVFYFDTKKNKYKYDALIEVSKNVKDSEEISSLLNSFKESKKSNTDLRRTGLVTLFTGIGLAALGKFGLNLDVLFGVGLLVMFIGAVRTATADQGKCPIRGGCWFPKPADAEPIPWPEGCLWLDRRNQLLEGSRRRLRGGPLDRARERLFHQAVPGLSPRSGDCPCRNRLHQGSGSIDQPF